ncbi:unnamed protein product, partial [Amoebophrya sp. A25]
ASLNRIREYALEANRERLLTAVRQQYGVNRDSAKELFLRLLYGGSISRWVEDVRASAPQSFMGGAAPIMVELLVENDSTTSIGGT